MIITKEELASILNKLSRSGNTYLCEAQFQFELAWELRKYFESQNKSYAVCLEYPSKVKNEKGKRLYYDIVIEDNDLYCVFELKYKTKQQTVESYGHTVELVNDDAQDLGRYDFLNDVSRIENFTSLNNLKLDCGYAIFITNDKTYWEREGVKNIYRDFALKQGRTIPNTPLKWNWKGEPKVASVGKNRINGFKELKGSYIADWQEYNEQFKYLMFEIK